MVVEKEKDKYVTNFFIAECEPQSLSHSVWVLDSGCSNHMSSVKHLFKNIDDSYKSMVKLGDNNQVEIERKGTILLQTSTRKKKLMHGVHYICAQAGL